MKYLTEEQILDIFMLAYRLGEIKDMSNLLNSDMRNTAKECIKAYLKDNLLNPTTKFDNRGSDE